MVRAYDSPLPGGGWQAWRHHLLARRLRPLPRLLACDDVPLTWGLSPELLPADTLELVRRLSDCQRGSRRSGADLEKTAARWLSAAEIAECTPAVALECLAWCWALPALVNALDESHWWRLLNHLIALAEEPGPAPEHPLARQLLLAELPLALAYGFGELAVARGLADVARRTTSDAAREILDGRRLPHSRALAWLRPLVACWTRCRALSSELGIGRTSAPAERPYQALVQAALRLSRPGGEPLFAPADAPTWEPPLLKAATRLAGGDTPRIARLATVGRATNRREKGLPRPAVENEWAQVALMRSDWTKASPQFAAAYRDHQLNVELSAGQRTLWSGAWEFDVRLDGHALEPVDDWQHQCWVSDHDVDYFELSLDLSRGVEIERHMLLVRKDRVLLMADAVLVPTPGTIEYRGRLPLAGFSRFEGEAETREGMLVVGRKAVARVLPLALPEWRDARCVGQLHQCDGALELAQTAHGGRLFAPLLFDLDERRIREETTWRQLTVAEDRQNVSSDVAVGYRAQCGTSQWVVYRSLAPPAIRSLLSKSLMHQFLFGNFPPSGQVETLLEIDTE